MVRPGEQRLTQELWIPGMVGTPCQAVFLGPLGIVSEKDAWTPEAWTQQATPPAVVTSVTISQGYAGGTHIRASSRHGSAWTHDLLSVAS